MSAPAISQSQSPEVVTCAVPDGLSVDVEDYFQVEAFADRIAADAWPQFPSRVVENTRRVLDLFAELDVQGTFFVLGWVAERQPALLRDIAAAGHELGCHSYQHRPIFRLTPDEFRADTRRARAAIEDAAGTKVLGYRAPTFSLIQQSLWAVGILAEEGFLYDSSMYPVVHDLYGMPHMPRFPFRWRSAAGIELYELPPMTVRILGRNLPACGGGALRQLPLWFHRWAARRVRDTEARPVTVYFHPWEIDPEQPRLRGTLKSRLRHYRNLDQMEARLRAILSAGCFRPLGELLQAELARGPLPTQALP
jgi:polysaccharide deacetylase family protein (PEP-CTERM system associated)